MDEPQIFPRLFTKKPFWRQLTFAFAIFFFLTVLIYFDFFFKGEIIAPVDILLKHYPWRAFAPQGVMAQNHILSDIVDGLLPRAELVETALDNQILPLWNSFKRGGTPLTLLFPSYLHPLVGIFFFLLPSSIAVNYSLSIIARILFGAVFFYLFLNKLELSFWPKLLGAILFTFFGFNVVWLGGAAIVSLTAPFLFWAAEKWIRSPTSFHFFLTGIATALMLLGGWVAGSGYFFYLVSAYLLARLAHRYYKKKLSIREGLLSLGLFGVAALIGVALTGVQLLPSLKYLSFTKNLTREEFQLAHLPKKAIVQLQAPFYWGDHTLGNWQGFKNFNESVGYAGVYSIVLLLLVPLLWWLTKKRLTSKDKLLSGFFYAFAIVSLMAVFKIGPVLSILRFLPVFNTGKSMRLFSVYLFSQAVLFALLVEWLLSGKLKDLIHLHKDKLRWLMYILGAAIGWFAIQVFLEWPTHQQAEPYLLSHMPLLRSLEGLFVFTALLVGILLVKNWQNKDRRRLWVGAFFLVMILDIYWFNWHRMPTNPKDLYYPTTPAIEFLQKTSKDYEKHISYDWTFLIPGLEGIYGLNPAISHSFHTPTMRRYVVSISKNAFVTATAPIPNYLGSDFQTKALDIMGVTYFHLPPFARIAGERIVQDQGEEASENPTQRVIQTFSVPEELEQEYRLQRVCVAPYWFGDEREGMVELRVLSNSGVPLVTKELGLGKWPQAEMTCVNVQEDVFLGPGENYALEFNFENADITLIHSLEDIWPEETLTLDGEVQDADLAISLELMPKRLAETYELIYDDIDLTVYKKIDSTAGLYIAELARKFESEDAFFAALKDDGFNPSTEVVVEGGADLPANQGCKKKEVQVEYYGFNKMRYRVNTDCAGVFTTPEVWYPGWKVFVDGEEKPLLKTNYGFRGVKVDSGEHKVLFSYEPQVVRDGLKLSVGSLIVLLLIWPIKLPEKIAQLKSRRKLKG